MSLTLQHAPAFKYTTDLPKRARVVEVGPRDGLQNLSQTTSIEQRVEIIDLLSGCGFPVIETGSLVDPRVIPQMADSETVYRLIKQRANTDFMLLIPNQRGFERANDLELGWISALCTASEAFSVNNTHCTIPESLTRISQLCTLAKAQNLSVRAYISCAFGCPYQGIIDPGKVCELAIRLSDMGCQEISLGDTIGIATPGQVSQLLINLQQYIPIQQLAVHFHDTYGQGLANCLAALQSGVSIFDSSVAGLGGCAFAPGASGNLASEDLVYMLNGLGISTGINLEQLIKASHKICAMLQRPNHSHVSQALAKKSREAIKF